MTSASPAHFGGGPRSGDAAGFSTGLLLALLALYTVPAAGLLARGCALPEAFPAVYPPGVDLRQMLSYAASLEGGGTPYVGANLYPPLAALLARPLLAVDGDVALALVRGAGLLAAVALGVALPLLAARRADPFVVAACGVAGLLSPALLFELERGQWNALATAAALCGALLFRTRPRASLAAFALLTLGVQLKLYPAVFALLYRRPGEDARPFARRLLALGGLNALLLLALGPTVCLEFLAAVREQALRPFTWPGNHSIRSFVLESPALWGASAVAGAGLVLFVVAVLLVALGSADDREPLPPALLLAATLAALLLPSQSHDYKLVLLPGPLAHFVGSAARGRARGPAPLRTALPLLAAVAFAATLVPLELRPGPLRNVAPALLVLAGAVAFTCRSPGRPAGGSP